MLPEIHLGDNLVILASIKPSSVSLVYMDPPFNTGKKQVGASGSYEDPLTFIDKFVESLMSRIKMAWELLDPLGSLIVHLDQRTVHYVKVEMDRELGRDHFASEIIWRYRRWPAKTPNFQKVHDVLLRYVKTPGNSRWNQLYEPLAQSTQKAWGDRKQQAIFDEYGKRYRSRPTSEESPGVPMGDVWEIGVIAPSAHERTGYPTQKPEALLERLISACTNPGDLVLDPYLGSGTTVAVAERMGRRGIGIDINPESIEITRKRIGIKSPEEL
jgi:site-specific DNA-methyltransferase (adenine-specific)